MGSSRPRDWAHVFCTGSWTIYHCTPWEAHRGKVHLCPYTNRQISCWQNDLRNTQICLGILEKWDLFPTFQVARWKTSSTLSHVQLFATPRTVTWQALLSVWFSRQVTGLDCYSLLQGKLPYDPTISLLGVYPKKTTYTLRKPQFSVP